MGTSLQKDTPMIPFEASEVKALYNKIWHYLLAISKIGVEEYQ